MCSPRLHGFRGGVKVNALVSKTQPKEHREMSTQEKLTEQERVQLRLYTDRAIKALRIIDARDRQVAELAAALDRVRDALKPEGGFATLLAARDAARVVLDEALAGAPAPEGSESGEEALKTAFQEYVKLVGYADWSTFKAGFIADAFKVTTAERTLREDYQRAAETAVALRAELAAANARIAELERQGVATALYHLERADAANARAEAAEQAFETSRDNEHKEVAKRERAEAESAALRAEVERLRALTMIQDEPDDCARCEASMDGHEAATSDICHDCWNSLESRLATAVGLLATARHFLVCDPALGERIEAFLAACAAPATTRTEADQAVLEYAEQLDSGGHDGIADRLREILGATRRDPK
jgi:hypothetical protein